MLLNRILHLAPPGATIPKPAAVGDFKVKGMGERRGEEALIYLIPNVSVRGTPPWVHRTLAADLRSSSIPSGDCQVRLHLPPVEVELVLTARSLVMGRPASICCQCRAENPKLIISSWL